MSKIRSSNKFRIFTKSDSIRILSNENNECEPEPRSVVDLLLKTVENYGEHPALAYVDPETKIWKFINYYEYKAKVDKIAKGFIKLGLSRWDAVAVLAFNSVEWFVSELAAIHAGGIITGIYTTNSVESTMFILEKSNAKIVIVDDIKQLEKIQEIRKKIPSLKVVHTRKPFLEVTFDGYFTWDELEKIETDDLDDEYKKRLSDIHANDCCSLIFTSGTTGKAKGVMLSHDNLTFVARNGAEFESMKPMEESIISYLPLSHIAGQIVDIYAALTVAATVYFAEKDALKGSLPKTLRQVRPTRFLGVPRVYEKMHEKMLEIGAQQNFLTRAIGNWAKSVCLQHHLDCMAGKPCDSIQYRIAKRFVISKVKQALGFDRCLTFASGAAQMDIETKKYFLSLDMPIIDIFGMSECSGGHSFSKSDAPSVETIGKGLPGVQTEIRNPNKNGHGEIYIRGRHVMMGYINDQDTTNDAIDEKRWLATGDVGYIDPEGYIFITGRIKEIIITAGGENIPPHHCESLVKSEIPAVSNAFLVGEKRKYLTILITLKTQMAAETGEPQDELAAESIKWIQSLNLPYTTVSEIIAAGPCKVVLDAIEQGISRANAKAISNAQRIQKFALLPLDFSIPTGEFGPTLKVKRNFVNQKYQSVIEKLYN